MGRLPRDTVLCFLFINYYQEIQSSVLRINIILQNETLCGRFPVFYACYILSSGGVYCMFHADKVSTNNKIRLVTNF